MNKADWKTLEEVNKDGDTSTMDVTDGVLYRSREWDEGAASVALAFVPDPGGVRARARERLEHALAHTERDDSGRLLLTEDELFALAMEGR